MASRVKDLSLCISSTTRSPRPSESPGTDYHFVDQQEFSRSIKDGLLLEWAEVHGHYYGTCLSEVLEAFENGNDALLEIDVHGGKKVKTAYARTVSVFLIAPSIEEIRKRLTARASDSEAEVKRRLARVREELLLSRHYDYLVVNKTVEKAVRQICEIISSERSRLTTHKYQTLLDSFKENVGGD